MDNIDNNNLEDNEVFEFSEEDEDNEDSFSEGSSNPRSSSTSTSYFESSSSSDNNIFQINREDESSDSNSNIDERDLSNPNYFDSETDYSNNLILSAASQKDIRIAFLQRKIKYPAGLQRRGINLSGIIIANIEYFSRMSNESHKPNSVFLKDVRMKRFDDDLVHEFLYQIKRRHSHVFPNTLFLIHVQLKERAYWFAHNSEQNRSHALTTMFGFYPFRLSRYQNVMMFDRDVLEDEIGYFKKITALIQNVLDEEETMSLSSEFSQRRFKPFMNVYLLNSMVLNTNSLTNFPSPREYAISVSDANQRHERAARFLSLNFYNDRFFDYIVNRDINGRIYGIKKQTASFLYRLKEGVDAETSWITAPGVTIVQDTIVQTRLKYALSMFATFVDDQSAMTTRKNFVHMIDKSESLKKKFASNTKNARLSNGNIITITFLSDIMENACFILTQFGLGINIMSIMDVGLCVEAQFETNFIHDVLYGPAINNAEKVTARREVASDVHAGFVSFETFEYYGIGRFKTYKKINTRKIGCWLIIMKFVIKHGFQVPALLALFKDIFQFVHYAYCRINNIVLDILEIEYDKTLVCELIFLRLFGNPNDVDSHIEFSRNINHDTDAIPFTMPVYFHMGFFTILQLCDFFFEHRASLLDFNVLKIPFYGCFATQFQSVNWTMSPNTVHKHIFDNFMNNTTTHTVAQNTDWNTVQESSINRHNITEALVLTQPYVMFGTKKLFLNQLGNACRRMYLSALPDKITNVHEENSYSFLKKKKSTVSPSQHDITNLIRFLNSDREEIRTLATILLNIKVAHTEGDPKKNITKDLEDLMVIKRYLTQDDPIEARSVAKNSLVSHIIHDKRSLMFARFGIPQDAFVSKQRTLAVSATSRYSSGILETIFEKRKKIQVQFNKEKGKKLQKKFEKNTSPSVRKMKPTKEEEEEFYADALLIAWFIQSPFYNANRYDSLVLIGEENQRSEHKRLYTNNTQPVSFASKTFSLDDANWPFIIDSLQNLKNDFSLSTVMPSLSNYSGRNGIIVYERDRNTNGIKSYPAREPGTVFRSKESLGVPTSMLERINTSSIFIPSLELKRTGKQTVGFKFFIAPEKYVYPMSILGKYPAISGSVINNLFEGFPVTFDETVNDTANGSMLTETIHHALVLFFQFIEMTNNALVFFSYKETGLTLYSNEYLPLFSKWISQNTKNEMNSKIFNQFIQQKLLNTDLSFLDQAAKIALFKKMFLTSDAFKDFMKYFFGDIVDLSGENTVPYSYNVLQNKFQKFLRSEYPINPRVKFVFDPIKISDLYDILEQRTESSSSSANSSSEMLPRMTINWTVADTFAAYEYLHLHKRYMNLLSPLQIFRTLSFLKDEEFVYPPPRILPTVFVMDEETKESFDRSQQKGTLPRVFAPKGPKHNEYYAPITGYVTRAMDVFSSIEYNKRSPSLSHHAVSRRARTKESLLVSIGDSKESDYYASGVRPIYDMDVRFLTTETSQSSERQHEGRQRLWSPVTSPMNTHMVEVKYDQIRKQWHLVAKNYLIAGNVIGFIFGEVSPIEIFVESTDLFDPKDVSLNEIATKEKAVHFSDYVSGVCENIFNRDVLYPVDEFGWFQFTCVKIRSPVLYTESVFENKSIVKKDGGPVRVYSALENSDITERYRTDSVADVVSKNAYREVRVICGYEIDASRFSSCVRYVRYTRDPTLANAEFKRVKRSRVASLGNNVDLNYWYLTITRYVPEGSEIIALIPSKNNKNGNTVHWAKFLIAGIPRVKLEQNRFGNFWNYPVKCVPIYQERFLNIKDYPNVSDYSTSLPIFGTRNISLGTIEKLTEESKRNIPSPNESHGDYISVLSPNELNFNPTQKELQANHDSFTFYISEMEAFLNTTKEFPANLVIRSPVVKKHMAVVMDPSMTYISQIPQPSSSVDGATLDIPPSLEDDVDVDDVPYYEPSVDLVDDVDNEVSVPSSSSSSLPLPEESNVQPDDSRFDNLDAGIILELAMFGSTFDSEKDKHPSASLQDDSQIETIEIEDYDSIKRSAPEVTEESLLYDFFDSRSADYVANYPI